MHTRPKIARESVCLSAVGPQVNQSKRRLIDLNPALPIECRRWTSAALPPAALCDRSVCESTGNTVSGTLCTQLCTILWYNCKNSTWSLISFGTPSSKINIHAMRAAGRRVLSFSFEAPSVPHPPPPSAGWPLFRNRAHIARPPSPRVL